MRTVDEYLYKASDFDALARDETVAALKKRYADLAECYRLLAGERQRLIAEHSIPSDPPLKAK